MITNTQLTLTPTARLARNQLQAYALTQIQQDRGAWQPPAILSFSAWIGALRNNYFLDTDDPRVAIDDNQANVLWQSLVAEGVFIGEPEVVQLANGNLVVSWRADNPGTGSQDILAQVFSLPTAGEVISGDSGSNQLDGSAGDDTMSGGAGIRLSERRL